MNLFKKLNNRYLFLFIFFIISILISVTALFIERKILGFGPLYHPDSAHYLKYQNTYFYLSLDYSIFENFKNYFTNFESGTLYYSIVHLFYDLKEHVNFSTPYRNIIKLNIFIYALTNMLILGRLIKKFDEEKKIDYFTLLIVIFFCFLPYKVHLSVNVLKETIILFILSIYVLYPNKFTFLTSLLLGTPMRLSFGFYYLSLIEFNKKFFKKYYPILIIMIFGIAIWYYKNIFSHHEGLDFMEFLENRSQSDMGGRKFDAIPSFTDYGLYGSILRAILWPILLLSGTFVFFSKSIYLYIIGLEVIILQLLYFYKNKKFILSLGLIIFLALVSIYANTYTAYIRYCYLAINLYFLKIILNK